MPKCLTVCRYSATVCYRIDLNDAIRLIYLCIVYIFSKIFFTCNYPTAICWWYYDKRILFNICITMKVAFPYPACCIQLDILLSLRDYYTVSIKPVFHFNRIVAKRSVFHCFVNSQAEQTI